MLQKRPKSSRKSSQKRKMSQNTHKGVQTRYRRTSCVSEASQDGARLNQKDRLGDIYMEIIIEDICQK